MNYKKLSKKEEEIAKQIVDSAYTVHKNLGPGLLVPKGIAFREKSVVHPV